MTSKEAHGCPSVNSGKRGCHNVDSLPGLAVILIYVFQKQLRPVLHLHRLSGDIRHHLKTMVQISCVIVSQGSLNLSIVLGSEGYVIRVENIESEDNRGFYFPLPNR